ncbi:MAG: rod shape-determining protein MreC [Alphaproteobacteria bacterium]|tara:strand:+ start:404 stop:1282 length:879 start_codon:yes stop_codon:yes gene_type:complete
MAGISNLKRVQAIIRERTSNNKLITIFSFLLAFTILLSTFIFSNINYSIKAKVLDYSTIIISSLYSPINTINNSISNISGIINVHENNKKLSLVNENYKNLTNDIIILKKENNEYKKLLNISDEIDFKFVTSKIISRSNLSYTRSVILMSGKNDSIVKGSPVIYKKSLLGYINQVGNISSRLISITDGSVKIPSVIIEKDFKIIVSGNNNKYLEILNYDELSPIKEGDRVFTSGDGNMYPENLFVGTIMKKSSGDLIIVPSVDINNLNYVYILNWSRKDRGIDIKADPIFYD